MIFRDYTPGDRSVCLAVFDSNVPWYFVPHEREEYAAYLDALPGPYFVVEEDCVVGCGGYAPNADGSIVLCWGMVRHELHGQGIGKLLLERRLEHICRNQSTAVVTTNTSQHTRAFFEKFGFVCYRVIPNGYAEGLDRCEMRLAID